MNVRSSKMPYARSRRSRTSQASETQVPYNFLMAPPRLLFVDDESGIRLTLSAILQQNGFDVTVAASVPDALALIGKNRYEVLLSDLNIGEPGDGFTVVSAMRRSQPQAATFILTGYPDFESALLAIRNQVDDYFTKPANIKTLVRTITARLAQDIETPEPVPLRRVSDILRENAESICDEWLRAVGENGDLLRIRLTPDERKDHTTDAPIIEHPRDRVRRITVIQEPRVDLSHDCGLLRWPRNVHHAITGQGLTLSMCQNLLGGAVARDQKSSGTVTCAASQLMPGSSNSALSRNDLGGQLAEVLALP